MGNPHHEKKIGTVAAKTACVRDLEMFRWSNQDCYLA